MPKLVKKSSFCAVLLTAIAAISGCGDSQKDMEPQLSPPIQPKTVVSDTLPKGPMTLDESNRKCIDIKDSNHAPGTAVMLNDCNGADNQAFVYTNGHLRAFIHKCLTVAGGQDAFGAKVVTIDCDPNSTAQMWTRKGRTWIWTKGGKCLDLPNNSVANGAQLQIYGCNGSGAQNWSDPTIGAAAPPALPTAPATPTQYSPGGAFLPQVKGSCPALQTGMQTFNGQQVQLWAADSSHSGGSLVLYWHATGGNSAEAGWGFGTAQINDVVAKGGMVASFNSSTGTGANLNGNHVWFGDDFYTADQVVACAIRDLHIDPRRIYVTGASAGGLATTWMSYARSGYIAATAPLSGGMLGQAKGFWGDPSGTPQDPTNVPFAMVTHGGKGVDVYQPTHFDFAIASGLYEADVASKGGMSIDCNTGGGHVAGPPTIGPFVWQFFQDHPFKQTPEPYQGKVPANFPSYCKIGPVSY